MKELVLLSRLYFRMEDTFKDLPEDKDQQIKQDLEEIVE